MSATTTKPTTEQKIESTIGQVETGIQSAAPILGVVNSLAATYGGNIYRKVAGTVTSVQTWEADHPLVMEGVTMMQSALASFGINVAPELNLGNFILGALGSLMATDPTVQGPQPPPSVAAPAAAA